MIALSAYLSLVLGPLAPDASWSRVYGLGTTGLGVSMVVMTCAVLLHFKPRYHGPLGAVIILFGLGGFGPWNATGGFAIGSILAIAGGILAALHGRSAPKAMPGPPAARGAGALQDPSSITTFCTQCGVLLRPAEVTCRGCGAAVW